MYLQYQSSFIQYFFFSIFTSSMSPRSSATVTSYESTCRVWPAGNQSAWEMYTFTYLINIVGVWTKVWTSVLTSEPNAFHYNWSLIIHICATKFVKNWMDSNFCKDILTLWLVHHNYMCNTKVSSLVLLCAMCDTFVIIDVYYTYLIVIIM